MKKTLGVIIGLFILSGVAFAVQTGLTGRDQHQFLDYTRHHDIPAGAAQLGPTAPSIDVTGTAGCLAFDSDAELVYLNIEVPYEWIGTSDVELDVDWHPEDGDPIANGETVKWDIDYRSIAYAEAVDNGTAVSASTTYTETGSPGTDKEFIDTGITIDYDNANQPLTREDNLLVTFSRDVTGDTYSGDAIVCQWYINFTANKLATH